jgi:hypothetical protein
MNATKLIATIGLSLAGLAGAGFLYMQAQDIDNTRLERAGSLIRTLQTLDGRWSVELLKVSGNPQAHFDGLAAISPEVTRHSRELKKIARKDPSVIPDLKSEIMGYISRLDSKAERVERFKSAYAIVRNSERYLPVAVQLVSARAAEFQETALDRSVQTNHADLKSYFVTPSDIEKQRIMLNLNGLRSGQDEYPAVLRSALGNFLAHGLVLMAQKGPLNEMSSAATNADSGDVATTLIEDVASLIAVRTNERAGYERFSIGVAFITVVGFVLAMTLSRRVMPAGVAPGHMSPGHAPQGVAGTQVTAAPDFVDLDATLVVPPEQQAARASAAAPEPVVDASEQIRSEFLLQLVRSTARRLGSHVGLMKEVYTEVSKGVADSQATLVVGDTRTANSAIIETKATLGELGDMLDLNSVPKLIDATTRTIDTVERASIGFHTHMQSIVESEQAAFNVVQCIERALVINAPDDSGIAVSKGLVPVQNVAGSSDELAAALRCIISNAREELREKGDTGVIKVQTAEELGAISITFTDNGQGMEPETRQRCTEAFFTTKEEHQGLGLSTAEYIIRKHGGRLSVNTMQGRGTVVRVVLPGEGEELPPE